MLSYMTDPSVTGLDFSPCLLHDPVAVFIQRTRSRLGICLSLVSANNNIRCFENALSIKIVKHFQCMFQNFFYPIFDILLVWLYLLLNFFFEYPLKNYCPVTLKLRYQLADKNDIIYRFYNIFIENIMNVYICNTYLKGLTSICSSL